MYNTAYSYLNYKSASSTSCVAAMLHMNQVVITLLCTYFLCKVQHGSVASADTRFYSSKPVSNPFLNVLIDVVVVSLQVMDTKSDCPANRSRCLLACRLHFLKSGVCSFFLGPTEGFKKGMRSARDVYLNDHRYNINALSANALGTSTSMQTNLSRLARL